MQFAAKRSSASRNVWKIAVLFILIASVIVSNFSEVDSLARENYATAVFEEQYCSTWEEYQAASGVDSPTWNDVVDAMDEVIAEAEELYAQGDADGAYDCINDGYYGYYETTGFERIAMGYIAGSRKTEMELQFATCKAVTRDGGSTEEFNAECETLSSMLREDACVLDGVDPDTEDSSSTSSDTGSSRSAAVATFIGCFTILLKEGFEAILVVAAMIAYIVKSREEGHNLSTKPIYLGAIIGIVVSFAAAGLFNLLMIANTASQELIEGITALIAVVVLYYVSNWMISKSESEAWSRYIKSKVKEGADRNSMFALAFTSFLAVFREGAEVILFYQPMLRTGQTKFVWAGFLVGAACLVVMFILIRFASLKIPLKPFFTGASILMFVMAISFLGSGIKELIEGDVITMWAPSWVTWIPTNNVLEVFGIYPCGQSIVAQIIALVITVIVFVMQLKRNKRIKEEVRAEKAAEEAAKIEAAEN